MKTWKEATEGARLGNWIYGTFVDEDTDANTDKAKKEFEAAASKYFDPDSIEKLQILKTREIEVHINFKGTPQELEGPKKSQFYKMFKYDPADDTYTYTFKETINLPLKEDLDTAIKQRFKRDIDPFFIDGTISDVTVAKESTGDEVSIEFLFSGLRKALEAEEARRFENEFDERTAEAPTPRKPKEDSLVSQYAQYYRQRSAVTDPKAASAERKKLRKSLEDKARAKKPWTFETIVKDTPMRGHALIKARKELQEILQGQVEAKEPEEGEDAPTVSNLFQMNTVRVTDSKAENIGDDDWKVTVDFEGALAPDVSFADPALNRLQLRKSLWKVSATLDDPNATEERAVIQTRQEIKDKVYSHFSTDPKPDLIGTDAEKTADGWKVTITFRGIPEADLGEIEKIGIRPI